MHAWIITEAEGHIVTASRAARELFGRHFARGRDPLDALSLPRRAAWLDINVALTGLPAERTVYSCADPGGMRSRINRLLPAHGVGLFWQFEPKTSTCAD